AGGEAEGNPRARGRNQGVRRPERGRRGEDEHPGGETKGVRREARDGGQGPSGPEGAVRGRAEDRGPGRGGPREVHEGARGVESEAGRAEEGRDRRDAAADLLPHEGAHEPARDARRAVERPAVQARGDGDPDDLPRRTPDRGRVAPHRAGRAAEGSREANRIIRRVPGPPRNGDPRPREDGGPDGEADQGPPGRAGRRLQGQDGPRGGPRQGHAQDRDERGLPPEDADGAEGPGGAARRGRTRHEGDGGRVAGGTAPEPRGTEGDDRGV